MSKEEKIWLYLDGLADDGIRRWVEDQVENDPAFRTELEERRILHESLKAIPLSSPSMRFAKNIIDKLPMVVKPLLPSSSIRGFALGVGSFVLLYFVVAGLIGNTKVEANEGFGSKISTGLQEILAIIPTSSLEIFVAFGLGMTLLWLVDKFLPKFIQGGDKHHEELGS